MAIHSCEFDCKPNSLLFVGIFEVAVDKIMHAAYTALRQFNASMSTRTSCENGSLSQQRDSAMPETQGGRRLPVHCLKDVHFISNDAKITQQMIDWFKLMATDTN